MVVQATLEKERIGPVVLTCQEVLNEVPLSGRLRILGHWKISPLSVCCWGAWCLMAGVVFRGWRSKNVAMDVLTIPPIWASCSSLKAVAAGRVDELPTATDEVAVVDGSSNRRPSLLVYDTLSL